MKPHLPENKNRPPFGLRTLVEVFDVSPAVALAALCIAPLLIAGCIVYFIRSAPSTSVVISSGPEGSAYFKNAEKYAKILERAGVNVTVRTSDGSLQNLQRLMDPSSGVDAAFVQSGIQDAQATEKNKQNLVSLGSISYQPLLIFYRGHEMKLLSELKGKRVSIGPPGSGTQTFAHALLDANGIKTHESTQLLELEASVAALELEAGKIDAAFVMSESASTDILHKLLRSKDIELYDVKQASAYSRKIEFLNKLDIPQGGIDFGLNIPPRDIALVGAMVELIATQSLNPALSDLLLEAATEVHSKPGLFQHRGEFPAPIEHTIKMSDDATRFYKSGKSFFYKYLPFWLASILSRIIVVFIPTMVVLVPIFKSIPSFFRWRAQTKIRRRYRELLSLESDFIASTDLKQQTALRKHFERIDQAVAKMKVPAAFADQFYGLRGHIDYVRQLLMNQPAHQTNHQAPEDRPSGHASPEQSKSA